MTATIPVALYLDEAPASLEIMQALERIEITLTDRAPSGFQLVFRAERSQRASTDLPIVSNRSLAPMTRVQITASPGTVPEPIFDGYITHQELQPRSGTQPSTFTVSGEDQSVLMDLIALTIPWPAMTDIAVATVVLAKYLVIGVTPEPSVSLGTLSAIDPDPDATVQQQSAETDRALLHRLAEIHGNRFYLVPGPVRGKSTAWWGPPRYDQPPGPALSVDQDGDTNTVDLSFTYDYMAPSLYMGLVQNTFLGDLDLPVTTFTSTRTKLATTSPLGLLNPYVRRTIVEHAGLDVVRTMMRAQQQTDASTDQAATGHGTVDTLRYRHLIKAGTTVAVRGAGHTFDGAWYVQQVVHRIEAASYRQELTLNREGVGSTLHTVRSP